MNHALVRLDHEHTLAKAVTRLALARVRGLGQREFALAQIDPPYPPDLAPEELNALTSMSTIPTPHSPTASFP